MGRNLGPLNIKDSYEGLVQISGSDQLTDGSGSLISSLDITASAANQVSASQDDAALPRRVMFRDTLAGYDEVLTNDGLLFTPSTGILQTTSSFATTASFALNVVPIDTGSFMVTGSATDATLTFTKGDGSTFDLTVDNVANATSASFATSASQAETAVTASFLPSDTNLNINSITASFASFQSASIGYLESITGSAKIIGDAFIILNNNTPTERYAGLVVQDSGSTNNTASLEFDGQTNDWFYEYTDDGGATTDHGVAMFGPEYNTKGSPIYNTANTLVKGNGGHHLEDSSITDDGTLVTINANVSASGYVSASEFIGDGSKLTGIATATEWEAATAASSSVSVLNNTPSQIAASAPNSLLYSSGSSITAGLGFNVALGGQDASLGGGGYGTIINGLSNEITDNFLGSIIGGRRNDMASYAGFIAGASDCTVDGGFHGFAIGTQDSEVVGNRDNCGIIGGDGNTVSHNRSVVVGGDTLSTTKDDEVVVNHLSIYGDTLVDDGTNTGTLIDNVGQSAVSSEDAVNTIIHLTQAEYDALTPDANTLYVIEGAETLGDTEIDGQLTGAVNTISDSGGTTALDCSVGNYFTLTMPAGGTTVLTPSNITAGQTINIKITQNATAATLTYDSAIDFPGGTAFTISTGAGEVDILTLVSFDGTTLQATGLANFS